MKKLIRALKVKYMMRWAAEFRLQVVQIMMVGNSEYIVAGDGSMRKIGRKQ